MNNEEAKKLGQVFLSEHIELDRTEPSVNLALHNFHASEEVLFRFKLFGHSSIGSSEYISVSRATGKVRYIGFCGE